MSLTAHTAFIKPYIFSVFPAGTLPTQAQPVESPTSATIAQTQPVFNPTSVIQIRSSLSLQVSQTLPFPFNVSDPTATQNATIRLLTSSPSAKSPLYALTTPLDKTAAANEGSSLWRFAIKPWAEQIDELVLAGRYSDALELLDTLDDGVLSDKVFSSFLDSTSKSVV